MIDTKAVRKGMADLCEGMGGPRSALNSAMTTFYNEGEALEFLEHCVKAGLSGNTLYNMWNEAAGKAGDFVASVRNMPIIDTDIDEPETETVSEETPAEEPVDNEPTPEADPPSEEEAPDEEEEAPDEEEEAPDEEEPSAPVSDEDLF